ncbi:MAG: hypothetical protein Q8O40_01140 [Chloroflexota bacterium]|nr:hypothetical protein [Chloroflexota bacterium]
MGKGKNRSMLEERQWLALYEAGQGIEEIASNAHRAPSTVWNGIQTARREREEQSIREGLLRAAYQKHQDGLLGLATLLRQSARTPNSAGLMPSTADLRTRLLAQGLESHIPNSQLWVARKSWEAATRSLEALREELGGLVEGEVRRDFPEVPKDGLSSFLWADVQERAMEGLVANPALKTKSGLAEAPPFKGGHLLSQWLSDKARLAGARERCTNVLQKLRRQDSSFLVRTQDNLRRWQEARDAIEVEVEVMLLRGIVPGRCRLCPSAVEERSRKLRGRRRIA